MPIPSKKDNEKPNDFMSRCMTDDKLKQEFPSSQQRTAVCLSKATENLDYMEAADFNYYYDSYGFEEEINEDNFVVPADADYVVLDEEELEWDVAKEKPGLWENIRRKKEREGKNYKPAQPGDPDRPTEKQIKEAQSSEYQGRKVKLNKPFRTPDGPKKFSVYVKNEKGNVVKVNFGDPNMEIKRDNPARRKSFRARHKCDTPGPKWKARYWSCRMW